MKTLIFPIFFLSLGIIILFTLGKRRFKRRNVAGLEAFSSYEKSLMVRVVEGIFKVLAYICIAVGLVALLAHFLK